MFGQVASATGLRLISTDINMSYPQIVLMSDTLATAPSSAWVSVTGATTTTACGLSGPGLFFGGITPTRQAITTALDTTAPGITLTFDFAYNGGCQVPTTNAQNDVDVYLLSSIDGGVTWNPLVRFGSPGFASSSTCSQTFPAGVFYCISGASPISISFDSLRSSLQPLFRSNATQFSLRQQNYVTAVANFDTWAFNNWFMAYTPVRSFTAQFSLTMNNPNPAANPPCGVSFASTQFPVTVDLSNDLGTTWRTVSSCAPSSAQCSAWSQPGQLSSAAFPRWTLVTLNLGLSPGPRTRVRWSLINSVASIGYAIDNVFVGAFCPNMCNGQGVCRADGACTCWNGYSGLDCSLAPVLPTTLGDSFDGAVNGTSIWLQLGGCGESIECP